MLTADVALYRAWRAAGGPEPAIAAGHSLGEYAALVVSGALAFADALPLVRFRAQAMQEAVPAGTGAMAAVMGLDDATLAAVCAEAAQGQVVEPVNFNAPAQIVIAGHREAVERAIALAKTRGAKRGLLLPVSAPFHSSLLKPAAERLADYLARVDVARAVDSGPAQCRCRQRSDARRNPRCAGAPGSKPGALGRHDAGFRRRWRDAHRRMRARDRAHRTGQTHGARARRVCDQRRRCARGGADRDRGSLDDGTRRQRGPGHRRKPRASARRSRRRWRATAPSSSAPRRPTPARRRSAPI